MGQFKGISIISTGHAAGSRIVKNEEISAAAGTTAEWIAERTGIESRCYCGEDESNVTLAVDAAGQALRKSGLDAKSIGLCIVATMTPSYATPSTACLVQSALGLREDIASYDINAACSGFLYALDTARAQLYMNDIDYALVIGSEKFSDMLDMSDYGTAVLFGDGAGAVIIARANAVYFNMMYSRGSSLIWADGPAGDGSVLHMQGRQVFKFATTTIEKSINLILKKSNRSIDEIDHFVLHQANERIIDFVIKHMKLRPERVHKNIKSVGNTSAASIPLLMDQLVDMGRIKKGELVLFVGFGAGLTWSAVLLEWT